MEFLPFSEINRRSDADEVAVALALLAVPLSQNVVPLDLHVGVQKPVQPDCHVDNFAPCDLLVNQIQITAANADLPGTEATRSHRIVRNNTSKHALRLHVGLMFACQKVQDLGVSTMEVDGPLVLPVRGHCVTEELAGPFGLKRPGAQHSGQFRSHQKMTAGRQS